MMNRVMIAMGALCLLAGAMPQAHAQQRQQGFTDQELDRMSEERTKVFGPANHGPPPPLSSIPKLQLFQPKEPLLCKGTTSGQPVYSAPAASAPPMAQTMEVVAVGGRTQNGFARIVLQSGRIGWIPADTVHDYVSRFRPGTGCQVEGVRANGAPVFSYN
jgi:hypothetical protein